MSRSATPGRSARINSTSSQPGRLRGRDVRHHRVDRSSGKHAERFSGGGGQVHVVVVPREELTKKETDGGVLGPPASPRLGTPNRGHEKVRCRVERCPPVRSDIVGHPTTAAVLPGPTTGAGQAGHRRRWPGTSGQGQLCPTGSRPQPGGDCRRCWERRPDSAGHAVDGEPALPRWAGDARRRGPVDATGRWVGCWSCRWQRAESTPDCPPHRVVALSTEMDTRRDLPESRNICLIYLPWRSRRGSVGYCSTRKGVRR